MQLSWVAPSGAWDQLRLTRDSNGYTPRSDMGQILLDVPAAIAPTSYTDMTNLTEGRFYYYTVWVHNSIDGSWRRAADTTGLVVQDWKYSDRLYNLLPMMYRDQDDQLSTTETGLVGPLQRFISLFGFQVDHIRTEMETLKNVNNPNKVAGGLLPLMAKQWGFGFEQELGMRLSRIQCRNAVHMYKLKGTRLGLEAAVSALTGWAPTVAQGVNQMLDQNDSSFVQSLGRWQNQTNSLITTKDITVAPTFGPAVPAPSGASTGNVGSGNNVMRMTAIAAGDMEARCGSSLGLILPVVSGVQYTFSGYAYAGATPRSVRVRVYWYDIAGNFLSTSDGALVADSIAAWTRPVVTAAAPANAYWAGFSAYVVAAAAGEIHYWDAFQFEQAAAASAWQSARDVRIYLKADRVNLLLNPSFEVNAAHWTGVATGANTSIARSTTYAHSGASSLAVTAGAAGQGRARTLAGENLITPGRVLTGSIYILTPTAGRTVRVRVQWWDAGNVEITAAASAGPDVVTGTSTTVWTRLSRLSAVAPVNAASFTLDVQVDGMNAGEVFYVDDGLAEYGSGLGAEFSGDFYSPEGEYIWEGTPGGSRTHYYVRRLIKNFRLNQRLMDFLPAGATYTLIYADPSTVT